MYYLTIYYKIHMVWWGNYSINIKARLLIGTLENTVSDDFEKWSHLDPPTPDSTEVPEASRRFNFTVKQLQRHHAPMLSKGAWWPNRAGPKEPKKPNAWRFKIHHMTILENFYKWRTNHACDFWHLWSSETVQLDVLDVAGESPRSLSSHGASLPGGAALDGEETTWFDTVIIAV